MKKMQLLFSSHKLNLLILSFLPCSLIIYGLLIDTLKNIFIGLYNIIISPDILPTDYLAVAGVGATFVNVGLLVLICILIIYFLKTPLT